MGVYLPGSYNTSPRRWLTPRRAMAALASAGRAAAHRRVTAPGRVSVELSEHATALDALRQLHKIAVEGQPCLAGAVRAQPSAALTFGRATRAVPVGCTLRVARPSHLAAVHAAHLIGEGAPTNGARGNP